VQSVINYPIALPFLPAYDHLKHSPEDFPNAHSNQSQILSIPIYPELSNSQMIHVVDALTEFTKRARS
jgi:dTDP-4-amino-4,6-dideoxygalactose transaminase